MTAKDQLAAVYQWVCQSRGEQTQFDTDYIWSERAIALVNRLQNTHGNFILVVGPQGAGKTTLCNQLPLVLSKDPDGTDGKIVVIKWTGEQSYLDLAQVKAMEYNLELIHQLFSRFNLNTIYDELNLSTSEYDVLQKIHKNRDELPGTAYQLFTAKNIKHMEKMAGVALVEQAKKDIFEEKLEESEIHTFVIDLCDYNKTKLTELDSHIHQIQEIWIRLQTYYSEFEIEYEQQHNLVLFVQEEIYNRYKHFFLGKAKPVFFIEPFKATTLVNFYKHKFGDSTEPFTPDALLELAVLSRGIFRRFKTYIGLCLDSHSSTITQNISNISTLLLEDDLNNRGIEREVESIEEREDSDNKSLIKNRAIVEPRLITKENVKDWIQDKILIQDLELELHNIFPKQKGLRNITVQLLRRLAHTSLKQSDIAHEYFDDNKANASRFLSTLEENDYITRTYDDKDKVVKLPEASV